ncbi:MAG: flagellar hook-basal body complex protein [Candidatus Baltobacteraceae bacterium]
MNRALAVSASGMAAEQANLDIVAANLANADVAGFKAATATFATLGGGSLGTALTGTHAIFTQGKLMRTGGPFDVAIQGRGFFVVERDGTRAYTRAGSFERAADGRLRNADGWRLTGVRIPSDASNVTVAADGRVSVRTPHGVRSVGRIALATFDADEELRTIGSALFAPTAASGRPRALVAGGSLGPTIAFGALEKSNVSVVESMMAILTAQRAYEANAKGVQAADEMLRIANNLHRA